MSLKTWREEFYPVEAADVSRRSALAHSLRKWEGMRPAALEKHGVERLGADLVHGASEFTVDSASCALCVHHLYDDDCTTCPLFKVRGGVRCDQSASGEEMPPYAAFIVRGDPEPMIRLLKLAKRGRR